jgi:hypothetical protein
MSSSLNPASLSRLPRNDKNGNRAPLNRDYIGYISLSSVSKNGVGLDWALVKFSLMHPRSVNMVDIERFQAAISSKIPDTPQKVYAVNSHGMIMQGTISPNPTMMRLPFCRDFQELWTVRFDRICGKSQKILLVFL